LKFSKILIDWYLSNKRPLPWRDTNDPYAIWVSEIILQQTRVNQGLNYYHTFMKHFPELQSLAHASLDEVMKVWQGLGYYSRAMNMHKAAKYIDQYHNGHFPDDFFALLKIPGIGSYTAAAIASFAFGRKVPVVDGNVIRVLSRIFGIYTSAVHQREKKIFFDKAMELIDPDVPGKFNQAIMEFGAMQCVPKNPDCTSCPFSTICYANIHKAVQELPVKRIRKEQRKRYFHYFVLIYRDEIILQKRNHKDIWKELYEFPLIETEQAIPPGKSSESIPMPEFFGSGRPHIRKYTPVYKHILSHQIIHARFYLINTIPVLLPADSHYISIPVTRLPEFPVPRLIDKFIHETDWLK